MLIYRVENYMEEGPYTGMDSFIAMCYHFDQINHPIRNGELTFYHLGLPDNNNRAAGEKKYRFGFTSIKQLRNWFSEADLVKLKGLGFYPVTYSGKIIKSSATECIFNRNDVERR